MITKDNVIAIVGASNNPKKYGHIVMKNLLSKGYDVIPINLKEETILQKRVYKSIKDVGEKIDVVIFVVHPEVTDNIIKDVKSLGIKKVWMQPGSESEKAIKFCKDNNIECTHNSCIMI
jgi:predicted CoA-binding protein